MSERKWKVKDEIHKSTWDTQRRVECMWPGVVIHVLLRTRHSNPDFSVPTGMRAKLHQVFHSPPSPFIPPSSLPQAPPSILPGSVEMEEGCAGPNHSKIISHIVHACSKHSLLAYCFNLSPQQWLVGIISFLLMREERHVKFTDLLMQNS